MIKRFLILALGLSLSLNVWAQDLEGLFEGEQTVQEKEAADNSDLGYVKKINSKKDSEMQVFFRYFEAKDWAKALMQYQPAFGAKEMARTEEGKALYSFLQYKAGLKITALESLFKLDAKKIPARLKQMWAEATKESPPAWNAAQLSWAPEWIEVFGKDQAFISKVYALNSNETVAELEAIVAQTLPNTEARAQAEWKLALAYGANDQVEKAAKLLGLLAKLKNPPVSLALMNLTAGRMLYQNGYFPAAIKYYEKIDQKSEYWIEAQEELAWSYVRKGELQNAVAIGRTLTHPGLGTQAGPEAYFVSSLAHLKVCDYPTVMENLARFSPLFKARTLEMVTLSADSKNASVDKLIALLKKGRIKTESLGAEAKKLPRFIFRDEVMYHLAQMQQVYEEEAKRAEVLYAQSLAATGLQAHFIAVKQALEARAHSSQSAAYTRVKELAGDEVKETKEILRKLHIVEAEVIQQVALADQLKKNAKADGAQLTGTTGAKGQDTIHFPGDNEIWFDEISTYKIDLKKGCQAKR